MPEGKKTFVSKKDLVLDAFLIVVLLAFWYWVAASHVPSIDPVQIRFWGAFTSACMTGVSWLAWQMVRVVYRHQKKLASGK